MNFKNFKRLKFKNVWRNDFSGYQYPLMIKSHLWGILHTSWSYTSYIENLLSKSDSLSSNYRGESNIPLSRLESAIYLKKEAERIQQMIKEDKSKNREAE